MANDEISLDDSVLQAVQEYLEAADAGELFSREDLLAKHPGAASEIAEFLRDIDAVQEFMEADTARLDDNTVVYHSSDLRQLGRFELLEEVGRGTFGTVWKAHDPQLGRTVAIKVPHPGAVDPRGGDSILREAMAAAHLRHPNIVQVHEFGEEEGVQFIVSDFIEGTTLREWISDHEVSTHDAATIIQKVAEALQHAHEHGVVHRDLKPSNILLDARGEPHITDFGLARRETAEATLTVEGQILGTPAYMPPEQAAGMGHKADARSDVYSLGAVLFHLLTGRMPFLGSAAEVLRQVVEIDPPNPRSLSPGISEDLATITFKCLEKTPSNRYQSAKTLADELGRYLKGEPILARPISQLVRCLRWAKRKPAFAASLAAVALAVVLGTGVSLWFGVEASKSARIAAKNEIKAVHAEENAQSKRLEAEEALERAQESETQAVSAADRAESAQDALTKRSIQFHLADGNWLAANAALERTAPKRRGWEYYYLRKACHRFGTQIGKHSTAVSAMAANAETERLITGDVAGMVAVWDLVEKRRLYSIRAHQGATRAIAILPDRKEFLSAGSDGSVKLWDAASGDLVRTFQTESDAVHAIVCDPGEKRIATAGVDNVIRIWDSSSAKLISTLEGHDGNITSLAVDSKGEILASGCDDNTVRLWDFDSYKEIHCFSDLPAPPVGIAFSSDNSHLVATTRKGDSLVWNIYDKRLLKQYKGLNQQITSMAFNAKDDQMVTTTRDRKLILSTYPSLNVLRGIHGHEEKPISSTFVDSNRIVSADIKGTVMLWDLDAERPDLVVEAPSYDVAFSSDGSFFSTTSEHGKTRLWDSTSGKNITTYEKGGWFITSAIGPKDKLIAAGGHSNRLCVWDKQSAREIHTFIVHEWGAMGIAFHPREPTITALVRDRTSRLVSWDLNSGKIVRETSIPELSIARTKVVYSKDGSKLAWHTKQTVVVEDSLENKTIFKKVYDSAVSAIDLSSDGHTLVIARDNEVEVIRNIGDSSTKLDRSLLGHHELIRSLDISPDGKRVVTGSNDLTLRLWDTLSGEEVLEIGHPSLLTSVTFSPDGNILASKCYGGSVRLWSCPHEEQLPAWPNEAAVGSNGSSSDRKQSVDTQSNEIAEITTQDAKAGTAVTAVAFSSDERLCAIGTQLGIVAVVDLDTRKAIATLDCSMNSCVQVEFSLDSQRLLVRDSTNKIRLWDWKSNSPLWNESDLPEGIIAGFHPRQNVVLVGRTDHRVSHYSIANGKETAIGNRASFVDLGRIGAFSHARNYCAMGTHSFYVTVWNIESNRSQTVTQFQDEMHLIQGIAFSPRGERLAKGGGSSLSVWDYYTGAKVQEFTDGISSLSAIVFGPDGQSITAIDNHHVAYVFDIPTGRTLFSIRSLSHDFECIAFSPNSQWMALGDSAGFLHLWYAENVFSSAARSPKHSINITSECIGSSELREKEVRLLRSLFSQAKDESGNDRRLFTQTLFDSLNGPLKGAVGRNRTEVMRLLSEETLQMIEAHSVAAMRLLKLVGKLGGPLSENDTQEDKMDLRAMFERFRDPLISKRSELGESHADTLIALHDAIAVALAVGLHQEAAILLGELEELVRSREAKKWPLKAHVRVRSLLATCERYQSAAICARFAVEAAPDEPWFWQSLAYCYLLSGNDVEYQNTCRQMLEKFAGTDDKTKYLATIRACLSLPKNSSQKKEILQLAKFLERSGGNQIEVVLAKLQAEDYGGVLEVIDQWPSDSLHITAAKAIAEARLGKYDASKLRSALRNTEGAYHAYWEHDALLMVLRAEIQEILDSSQ